MKSYFPQITLKGQKMVFNLEAIETMELDVENASVIVIETTDPNKKRNQKEIFIMKTNGSLCDDLENVKNVFPPEHIREVFLEIKDSEIISGSIDISETISTAIKSVFGDNKNEFKLLLCNTESALGKEFKEQFEIKGNYYKIAYTNDKRSSIGKEKNVKETVEEERISIN
jgi:hypothetical protein